MKNGINHNCQGTGLIFVSVRISVFLVLIFFGAGNIDSRQKSAISDSKARVLFEVIETLGTYSKDGFRSFLLIYNKGIVALYAGDFGGNKVDLGDKRTVKINLRKF